jgi:hypothetical protein
LLAFYYTVVKYQSGLCIFVLKASYAAITEIDIYNFRGITVHLYINASGLPETSLHTERKDKREVRGRGTGSKSPPPPHNSWGGMCRFW